ncbi:MAG: hypothetical protein ACREXU_21240 [Gammaproteobacteria bacterium]
MIDSAAWASLPAQTGGTEITRFNALRHGVLSRYTVLPWEAEALGLCVLTLGLRSHGEAFPGGRCRLCRS